MISYFIFLFLISLFSSYIVLIAIIPQLKKAGIVGIDLHKSCRPKIAEMGGIGIVVGFTFATLTAVFFNTFLDFEFNLIFILAAFISILLLAVIGCIDDLLNIPQSIKAILPLIASIPLIAVKAVGSTVMYVPFLGTMDFGLIYLFVFIPLGIAVASNLTNMFAGFNGLEAGMGSVLMLSASIIAFSMHSIEALVLYIPLLGALVGFLIHNKYPANVFPGDTGTLIIGATLAAGAIVGNFESIAALLMLLYVVDFFIKAKNKFPRTDGKLKNGKLYAPENKITGFVHIPMVLCRGISEQKLVFFCIILQIFVSIGVLYYFDFFNKFAIFLGLFIFS